MTDRTLRAIGELLDATRPPGSFAARHTASAENLALEVEGVGAVRWPVPPDQARRLCEIARPARYGRREQTLLDPTVRDTWEIPRDRVTIDRERWHATVTPVLDAIREDLGIPPGRALSAEFHSMLIYETGQFFRRHQDSEKADGMIGTLVVTLPSTFTGGDLVIEHRGQRVIDTGSPDELTFVAFYPDCEHEVLPVIAGHRISLTFNLVVVAHASNTDSSNPTVAGLAEQLREHFATPVPVPSWMRGDGPESRPPRLLVHLLDHRYSQRGLGWDQLKGVDSARAAALVTAAAEADCAIALALADIRESYPCDEFEDEDWMCGMRRRWARVDGTWKVVGQDWDAIEGEDEPFEEAPGESPTAADHPELFGSLGQEQMSWSYTTLTWWIDRSGDPAVQTALSITDDELCPGGGEPVVHPYAFESKGFMGNEGNTMDRWYRRAAIVVWARQQPIELPAMSTADSGAH
ncbi:2OG-Fe(II) oxygenase [Nocardia sp. NBC_01377]|uniref:2OG-Fe(II) oxygenase n=1 Tax=Nocardia sp. NBC_01377 TaxID=2903595 RepID=UPI003245BB88